MAMYEASRQCEKIEHGNIKLAIPIFDVTFKATIAYDVLPNLNIFLKAGENQFKYRYVLKFWRGGGGDIHWEAV
jgi:hypothetical protein